ncbi:hypothetical protein F4777DRAFT_549088 [Nemania sp. FL0916]|nr:hypothetical protein F4777DRAFT_549088 [Nemania sp. FL0916]
MSSSRSTTTVTTTTAYQQYPSYTYTTSAAALGGPAAPPPYTEHAAPAGPGPGANANANANEGIELASIFPTSTTFASSSSSTYAPGASTSTRGPSSSSSSLPTFSTPTLSIFTPTKQLQIQTAGKSLLSFPTPVRPDPIPVFSLTANGALDRPLYLSVRPDAHSGSCFLTYGDDAAQTPLSTTTYRFGLGRPPVVVLHDLARYGQGQGQGYGGGYGNGYGDASGYGYGEEYGSGVAGGARMNTNKENEGEEESFEIRGRGLLSRSVRFAVPRLRTFGWRYAGSTERARANADSLLVCEVFLPASAFEAGGLRAAAEYGYADDDGADGSDDNASDDNNNAAGASTTTSTTITSTSRRGAQYGKKSGGKDVKTGGNKDKDRSTPLRIAQLVRSAAHRSPGSNRASAGNGGRLLLDLRVFDEKARERVEWLVVTTAVTMLKREVDCRRAQQIAGIGAIVL